MKISAIILAGGLISGLSQMSAYAAVGQAGAAFETVRIQAAAGPVPGTLVPVTSLDLRSDSFRIAGKRRSKQNVNRAAGGKRRFNGSSEMRGTAGNWSLTTPRETSSGMLTGRRFNIGMPPSVDSPRDAASGLPSGKRFHPGTASWPHSSTTSFENRPGWYGQ